MDDLTPAEKKLIAAAAKGEGAVFQTGDEDRDNPAKGVDWGPERTIRADVICRLATSSAPKWPLHWHGIQIAGARITGQIDLQGARLKTRLILVGCYIEEEIGLQGTTLDALYLQGSRLPGLFADQAKVKGNVFLNDGFHASGEVHLLGADIGGVLACGNGRFDNAEGKALNAERATVKGNVFLNEDFHATGEVRLLGTAIGGSLECGKGRFDNAEGKALIADGATVKGSVFLNEDFHATGEARLSGADIGGDLDCGNGTFENAGGAALSADGATVKGSIFLDGKFHATGQVRLSGADIGGDLACGKGTFENPKGYALSADRMTVKGGVFLIDDFHATGEVRLMGSDIGGDLACRKGRFEKAKGEQLVLERAKIAGALNWTEVTVVGTGSVSFHLASAGTLIDDTASWPAKGRLVLDGFTYDSIGGHAPTDWRARKDWLDRQWFREGQFRPQPYEQLIKVLRAMGHDRDARQIAIEKQRALRRSGVLKPWARAWNWFLELTIGHGYQPWRALVAMLFIVLWSGALFKDSAEMGIMVPAKERVYMAATYPPVPTDYPVFEPLIYSLDTFLPIVDLHQESYWLPSANKPWGPLHRFILWLHIALGWILTTLAVAGFTGLVKKD